MTKVIPDFAMIHTPIVYEDGVEKTRISEIPCSKTDFAELNRATSQLDFECGGNFVYRLSSPNTGFRVKLQFRTRDNVGTNKNALTTLSSNFFGHLFQLAKLELGGTVIEEINQPGVVMDTLYHLEEAEFRNHSGELLGFIPDNSDKVSTTIGDRQGAVAGADVAATLVSVNHADNKIIKYNKDFNKGFVRRMELYNYTVGANNDNRYVEIFIPLNRIFGFCAEVDKVLRYVPFRIELHRATNPNNCIYGDVNTSLDFGNDANNTNGGIRQIKLELEEYTFKAPIATQVEEAFAKPIQVAYLRRSCTYKQDIGDKTSYTWSQGFKKNNQGLPRYVFSIFKDSAADSAENNFQRCSHCNIQNITVEFINKYPHLSQNSSFLKNEFSKFYNDFVSTAKSLGFRNPALSMKEYRDLYTIFAMDISAAPDVNDVQTLSVTVDRKDPVGDVSPQNPANMKAYFITLCEFNLEIDCTNKVTTKN